MDAPAPSKRPRPEWKIRKPDGQELPVRGGIEALREMASSGKLFLALPLYFVTGGIAAGALACVGILVFAVAATQGK